MRVQTNLRLLGVLLVPYDDLINELLPYQWRRPVLHGMVS